MMSKVPSKPKPFNVFSCPAFKQLNPDELNLTLGLLSTFTLLGLSLHMSMSPLL